MLEDLMERVKGRAPHMLYALLDGSAAEMMKRTKKTINSEFATKQQEFLSRERGREFKREDDADRSMESKKPQHLSGTVNILEFIKPNINPVSPGPYTLTSIAGGRGGQSVHYGLDVTSSGTMVTITSPFRGTPFYSSGWKEGDTPMGYAVGITKVNSNLTMYIGHMASPARLPENGTCDAGDFIGMMGSTGDSTGPHAHIGIAIGGVTRDPAFLPFYDKDYQYSKPITEIIPILRHNESIRRSKWGGAPSDDYIRFMSEYDKNEKAQLEAERERQRKEKARVEDKADKDILDNNELLEKEKDKGLTNKEALAISGKENQSVLKEMPSIKQLLSKLPSEVDNIVLSSGTRVIVDKIIERVMTNPPYLVSVVLLRQILYGIAAIASASVGGNTRKYNSSTDTVGVFGYTMTTVQSFGRTVEAWDGSAASEIDFGAQYLKATLQRMTNYFTWTLTAKPVRKTDNVAYLPDVAWTEDIELNRALLIYFVHFKGYSNEGWLGSKKQWVEASLSKILRHAFD